MQAPTLTTALLNHQVSLPLVMVVIGAIFLGTLAISRFSLRFGIPAVLGVLLFGLAINPRFISVSHTSIEWIHTLTLAMLLFYAGLCTELASIRGFLRYGLILAFGGVLISTLLLGLIIWATASPNAGGIALGFHQLPLTVALLIAACLGSTDAGATISVLESVGSSIPHRLRALVEFESSMNDPAAILFLGIVLTLSGGSLSRGKDVPTLLLEQVQLFVQKLGSGLVLGLLLGVLASFCLNRLVRRKEELLILGISLGMLSYGISEMLGGSGLISVYITGLFLCNFHFSNSRITAASLQETLLPFNTMTTITVFLLFGIAMNPARLLPSLSEGGVAAAGLMLIARPLSVLAVQPWSPFNLRETALISWCGLRGAVPLALSLAAVDAIPTLPGIDQAAVSSLQTNAAGIVFTVVMLNLLLQGLTLPHLSRWLGLPPDSLPPAAARR
ncbi:cation:proton antiporter [Cyanobium sp. FGCU-52]|nr:cation:proton antiporter [Cyanobium sp. FGCU52]